MERDFGFMVGIHQRDGEYVAKIEVEVRAEDEEAARDRAIALVDGILSSPYISSPEVELMYVHPEAA